ncbi:hypothetical protein [Bacillus sp. AFS041924]|uniref:DUF6944 family repetitive protein n=1 Tax=Bacillus sp. AFS041924 TaxID=2033503 RepID=UPI000BFE8FFA|nr:hypothetical protein [Bacillus sp. AFS041924]PGS47957.1 hypothetical protein COC46_19115 [Bacillus sp. AFS041924]
MNDSVEDLLLIGGYFLLFGTLTSAVGVSSKKIVSEDFGKDLFAKGNAIEAFGNSIQAIGREKLYKKEEKQYELTIMVGAWIQAAGNITNTVATGLEREGLEEEGHKLNAVGSVIQAIGAQLETTGALVEGTQLAKIEAYGSELIALGALIDGVGNVALLNDKIILGEQLLLVGSWVQVFGAILIVYALTNKRREKEQEAENHHEYRYGYYPKK